MRMDHKGRKVLLAVAVLCLTLFVAVPAALAAGPWDDWTLFQGFTYGKTLNKTAAIPTVLQITATPGNPLDTGPFLSQADGFYSIFLNAGEQGEYGDLQITIAKWLADAGGGVPGRDQAWQPLVSSIESNPNQVVPASWYLVPWPTTLATTVKNSKTGKAIKGAKVKVYSVSGTTNGNGKLTLSNLALWPGIKFSVEVSKSNYNTKTQSVSPFPNGTRTVTVKLKHK